MLYFYTANIQRVVFIGGIKITHINKNCIEAIFEKGLNIKYSTPGNNL